MKKPKYMVLPIKYSAPDLIDGEGTRVGIIYTESEVQYFVHVVNAQGEADGSTEKRQPVLGNDSLNAACHACLGIFRDYDEDEVKRFAPASVQAAWKEGKDISEFIKKRRDETLKDFTL